MTNPYSRYQQVDVLTMSPAQRVVLLYAHVLANLRIARTLTEPARLEERSRRLLKAQEILTDLLGTLDREAGGEVAANLARLYEWWIGELVALCIRWDAARLDRLAAMIAELHEAWAGAAAAAPAVAGRGAAE